MSRTLTPPRTTPPVAKTLGGLLAEAARLHGPNPAIIHPNGRYSYAELEEASFAVARGLLGLGVRPGDRIALLMCNRPEWIILYYAAMKVGAILVPVNTWYRRDEIAWTLKQSRARFAVIQESYLSHSYRDDLESIAPGCWEAEHVVSAEVPDLDQLILLPDAPDAVRRRAAHTWDDLSGALQLSTRAVDAVLAAVRPSDPALVLYTSGSTAAPKGVVLENGDLVENSFHIAERRWFTPEDKVWIGSPLFYALGVSNSIIGAVSHGTAMIIQDRFDPEVALDLISAERATIYWGLGNMTRMLLAADGPGMPRFKTLHKGLTGAAYADRELILKHIGMEYACPSYGLTEGYAHSTAALADDDLESKMTANGRPLPGVLVEIRHQETGEPLAAGELGDVFVGGRLMRGYDGNPEATAESIGSDGFFATGDQGWLDAEGRFVFHARAKDLIKRGGINVSPVEVEVVIGEHPAVRDAHAVGVPDPAEGELLVVFVDRAGDVTEKDLKAFVKDRAASFKVPSRVLFRDTAEFPRLASGKVQRGWLKEEAIRELER